MVSYEVTFHQLSRWRGPRGPNKPNVWWEVVIDMHSQVIDAFPGVSTPSHSMQL